MLTEIKKQIGLIKSMSHYKEKTLNDLINTHTGTPLLIELLNYTFYLFDISFKRAHEIWQEKMVREYSYPVDHWDKPNEDIKEMME